MIKRLFVGTRGSGKTYFGARSTINHYIKNPDSKIAIIGMDNMNVRHIMRNGPSGIKGQGYDFKMMCFHEGSSMESFLDRTFDYVWIDELSQFSNPDFVLNAALARIKDDGEIVITMNQMNEEHPDRNEGFHKDMLGREWDELVIKHMNANTFLSKAFRDDIAGMV